MGVQRTAAFNQMWCEAVSGHPNALVTTYEALHEDAAREVSRIADWLRISLREDEVQRAVASGEFTAMQAREKAGVYDSTYNDKLRPGTVGDEESFKVRKGRVGGASDYLSDLEMRQCRSILERVATGH